MRWTRQRFAREELQGGLWLVSDHQASGRETIAADGEVVWS
jgi:hypothetical protein